MNKAIVTFGEGKYNQSFEELESLDHAFEGAEDIFYKTTYNKLLLMLYFQQGKKEAFENRFKYFKGYTNRFENEEKKVGLKDFINALNHLVKHKNMAGFDFSDKKLSVLDRRWFEQF